MVEFKREPDLPADGSDSTATFHVVDQVSYMYVWSGRTRNVMRYNLDDFSGEVLDTDPPMDFEQGKVLQRDRPSDVVYATPRDDNSSTSTRISSSEIVQIDVPELNYTVTEDFGTETVNPYAVVKGGEIYFWNYRDGSGNLQDGIYRINSDGTTTSMGSSGSPGFNGAAGLLDGTVYQFGGSDSNGGRISDIYQVDVVSGGSSKVADMTLDGSTFSLDTHFGRFFGAYFYSFGGRDDSGLKSEVWQIDPTSGEMEVLANMDQPMNDVMVGFDGSQLWSFGGYKPGSGATNYPDVYRIIRTRSDQVLLVQDDLSLRGVFPEVGDDGLLHTETHSRAELAQNVGDDVVLVTDGDAQG